jgi:Holliday junction resolvase
MLERDILNQCRDYLQAKGWYVIRIQQSLGCHKGLSDLICVKDSLVMFLEVKTPKGNQSDYQKEFERRITESGGQYLLVRSLDDLLDRGI